MISVHDYEVISYEVNLKDQHIVIHAEYKDRRVKIRFGEVMAHLFEDHLQGSILFDIDNHEIVKFIEGNIEMLEKHKPQCWPLCYETISELEEKLIKDQYKYYVIYSSYGFNGWVIAKEIEILEDKV